MSIFLTFTHSDNSDKPGQTANLYTVITEHTNCKAKDLSLLHVDSEVSDQTWNLLSLC